MASILAPFWEPFSVIFNVFRDRFLSDFLDGIFHGNGSQKRAKKLKTVLPFSSLFRSRSAGRVFEGSLADSGALLAPFGSLLAPVSDQSSRNVA